VKGGWVIFNPDGAILCRSYRQIATGALPKGEARRVVAGAVAFRDHTK
jgi:hypothetical protein